MVKKRNSLSSRGSAANLYYPNQTKPPMNLQKNLPEPSNKSQNPKKKAHWPHHLFGVHPLGCSHPSSWQFVQNTLKGGHQTLAVRPQTGSFHNGNGSRLLCIGLILA